MTLWQESAVLPFDLDCLRVGIPGNEITISYDNLYDTKENAAGDNQQVLEEERCSPVFKGIKFKISTAVVFGNQWIYETLSQALCK